MSSNFYVDELALKAMANERPDEPIFLINLLKYRETALTGYGVDGLSGPEAFRVYSGKFAELNAKVGGEPVWMGQVGNTLIGSEDWDVMILVRYPTRKQLAELLSSDEYQAIEPIKEAGLQDMRLIEASQIVDVQKVLDTGND